MTKLTSLDQLKVGSRLRIVGKSESDNYGSVSVKKIIICKRDNPSESWHEILINRSKNYYFHFENYLSGKSQWVKEVYVLNGIDGRLKNKDFE